MIGYSKLYESIALGLKPNKNLTVDLWSDQNMIIPKSTGSREYGQYRTERTPHAREIMRCLSDSHPCRRVIAMVASQMFKTQICLNWLGTIIDQSPSNFILSMPTGKLQKRIGLRIDKVVHDVSVLREKVAKPKSRDAMNNQDIKEFIGGSLFIVTSGSSANLSEVPAKYAACDEVDRGDEDHEGSRVKLIEARQTSFGEDAKSYYYSSPTIDEESEIQSLFLSGTQREALAECIHCGHAQKLEFEKLIKTDSGDVVYPCSECGGLHKESDKPRMFKNGLWSDPVQQSENESFTANALFLPYGWKSWASLMQDFEEAKTLLDKGDDSEMVVFYNTRLARVWKRTIQKIGYETLKERAESYELRVCPNGVLFLTAGVDTQDNRLAVQIVGWGRDLRAWVIDYVELLGDPADDKVWNDLTELLNRNVDHVTGAQLKVIATAIDIGGHRGEAVKNYVRAKRIQCPIAIHGATRIAAPPLSRGSMQDVNWKGVLDKKGVIIHAVGTIEIKHHLFSRMAKDDGKEPDDITLHFSNQLTDEYFAGVVSESFNPVKRRYEKKPGVRNESLDTLGYAYAALHHSSIRAHQFKESDWIRFEQNILNKKVSMSVTNGKINLSAMKRFG